MDVSETIYFLILQTDVSTTANLCYSRKTVATLKTPKMEKSNLVHNVFGLECL